MGLSLFMGEVEQDPNRGLRMNKRHRKERTVINMISE